MINAGKVRAEMLRKGITTQDLARMLRVSPQAVSYRIRSGKGLRVVRQLADKLGVPVQALID